MFRQTGGTNRKSCFEADSLKIWLILRWSTIKLLVLDIPRSTDKSKLELEKNIEAFFLAEYLRIPSLYRELLTLKTSEQI